MGLRVSKEHFFYSYSEEPHASRRKAMLIAHPEIKQLFGVDESFKFVVVAMVLTQILIAYTLKEASWPLLLLQAYIVGGTFNHALTLAIHEISHSAAFGARRPLANRLLGIVANLPLGVPGSIAFKKYHSDHHRYMGVEGIDTDLPTEIEARFFCTTFRKLVWLVMQPIFYGLRPLFVYRKALSDLEILNMIVQVCFDLAVWHWLGGRALSYLLLSMLLGHGLHPMSAHFISDHYVFSGAHETFSYYGPLNAVTFNVGHHREHHDFPFVPGSRLPLIRRMAPEFYKPLSAHGSWLGLLYEFVTNPTVGLRSRVKRSSDGLSQQFYGARADYSAARYLTSLISKQPQS